MANKTTDSRATTGVAGLDEILKGGLPRDRLYLLEGHPGAGKTTLALQFLLEGVRLGERGLYITLSETKEELDEVARSHGWSLDSLSIFELSSIAEKLKGETENTFFSPSEVELNEITRLLKEALEKADPGRVVFDSLSELRLLAETPLRHRRQILQLKQYFAGKRCTVLLLDDRTADSTPDSQILSLAHGVLALERDAPTYGVGRRTLNVVKIRGVKFVEGLHDFVINRGGISVFPRIVASEHIQKFAPGRLASGITGLDELLGGGLDFGTSNMFLGPPGTGKSTLAMLYACICAAQGHKVDFFLFDESVATLTMRAKAVGMNLGAHIAEGTLRLQQVDPAELSPIELIDRIRRSVENEGARMVVIDSINGYMHAMPEARYLTLQLHETLAYLGNRGVLTIMVLAQQGFVGNMQSSVDLTYLADSVLILRHFECFGAVRKAISVIKKRSGLHETTLREFQVRQDGIRVGPPLEEFQGVLSGVPLYLGKSSSILPNPSASR